MSLSNMIPIHVLNGDGTNGDGFSWNRHHKSWES